MSLIYITGPTGSGKSTIGEALRTKGYKTYDTDDKGMRKTAKVGDKELLTVDVEVLNKIHADSKDQLVFICGTSPTDLDAKELFSKIILLQIHESEQKERILNRTNNQYGKEPHQLANALKWREAQITKYKEASATIIDASQSIEAIVDQILAITQQN